MVELVNEITIFYFFIINPFFIPINLALELQVILFYTTSFGRDISSFKTRDIFPGDLLLDLIPQIHLVTLYMGWEGKIVNSCLSPLMYSVKKYKFFFNF